MVKSVWHFFNEITISYSTTVLTWCSWGTLKIHLANDLSATWFLKTAWPTNNNQNLILWILFLHTPLPRSFVRSIHTQIEILNRAGQRNELLTYEEDRRHLVGECSGNDHAIGLARRGAEEDTEPVDVVAGRAGVHHLHGAAGEAEGHGPDRALAPSSSGRPPWRP